MRRRTTRRPKQCSIQGSFFLRSAVVVYTCSMRCCCSTPIALCRRPPEIGRHVVAVMLHGCTSTIAGQEDPDLMVHGNESVGTVQTCHGGRWWIVLGMLLHNFVFVFVVVWRRHDRLSMGVRHEFQQCCCMLLLLLLLDDDDGQDAMVYRMAQDNRIPLVDGESALLLCTTTTTRTTSHLDHIRSGMDRPTAGCCIIIIIIIVFNYNNLQLPVLSTMMMIVVLIHLTPQG